MCGDGCERMLSLQLVPLLVLILVHQQMGGAGELLRLVRHPLGALLQLAQLVTALEHKLVRLADLGRYGRRPRVQRLDVGVRAGNVFRHRPVRLAARFAN